ncbi:hypothetical protein [Lysobacter gummosus]|uniref:hypothetical protein n=1 Tax=Lysobacter gummosus TaxID=262324 RepID=UPI00362E120C
MPPRAPKPCIPRETPWNLARLRQRSLDLAYPKKRMIVHSTMWPRSVRPQQRPEAPPCRRASPCPIRQFSLFPCSAWPSRLAAREAINKAVQAVPAARRGRSRW